MKKGLTVSFTLAVLLLSFLLLLCPRFDAPLSFAIYDREGKLLGASVASDEQWRLAPGKVSERLKASILAFEDRRFFLHPGIDPLSLLRAVYQNAVSGKIVSGSSTITMQTVRLSRKNPPRTLMQKGQEALLALILELRYSKNDILSLYAANAPFGGNVVGVEAASWRYFSRSPDNLTWAEAATLAVLPNQPSLVHPGADRESLREKRDRVLHALNKSGYINDAALALSLEERIPDKPYPLPRAASHYLERLKSSGTGATSIDRKMQLSVTSILERWSARFAESGINNAAALVIDTRTGDILAYVGNTGGGREKRINADVDIIVSKRSSGSLLKPFLFGAQLDAGLLLSDQMVIDIPTRVGSYKPENNLNAYQGVVSAGNALSRSLNIPAIRELRDFGIAPFLDLLRKSGFTTFYRSADEYGLPLILGGGEITLEEIVRAYAALMNKADPDIKPRGSFASAASSASASPAKFPPSPLSCGGAWLTLEALLNGARPNDEALWQSFASAQKIAWKTGTSYGNRDGWAVGVTPSYTVGVWVGNASGEGRPELKSITTAAPVLFDIFSILAHSPWPARPEMELEQVRVCALSGFAAGPDCARTKESWKPRGAPLGLYCPYCRSVSLTPDGKYQATVNDLKGKWSGSLPLIRKQFVLPPAIEYWYMRHVLSYQTLPPWIEGHTGDSSKAEIAVLFPEEGAKIFIPTDIDGKKGSLIFQAAHRNGDETIYWDIDGEYLGSTRNYHQLSIRVESGPHVLTITDTRGSRVVRSFVILKE